MKHLYFLIVGLLLSLTKLNAQTTDISIRDYVFSQASENYQFIPIIFPNAKVHLLITSDELSTRGFGVGTEIVGIQWYVVTDNTPNTTTYNIAIDDDFTDPAFSAISDYPDYSNISPSFYANGLTDIGTFTGWHTASFSTPFTWDGADNLVIQVCRTGGSQTMADEIHAYNSFDATAPHDFVTGYNQSCSDTSAYFSQSWGPAYRLIVNTTTLGVNNYNIDNTIQIYPNPSNNYLKISGLKQQEVYTVYTITGKKLMRGIATNNEKINIKNLTNGLYFLKFENGHAIKFVKK